MLQILLISLSGVAGVLLRYGCNEMVARHWHAVFPLSTFAINITGSFIIGAIHVLGAERGIIAPDLRLAIMTGLLGGFTTFSAFSLEVVRLLELQNYFQAVAYAAASPLLGVAAAAAGMWIAR